MFRDLKEYQEIAKIYAEKVSKPEDLKERRGSSPEQLSQNRDAALQIKIPDNSASNKRAEMSIKRRGDKKFEFNKPTGGTNRRAEMSLKRREMQNKPKPETDSTGKVIPSTAQIRADAAAKRGGTPAIGGGNAGASTDSGGTSKSTIKTVEQKPEVSTMTKQGKPRTKAQMMAAKRIAAGKTIDDVKAENQAAMKARAKAKFEAFKKRREEKKTGMSEGNKNLDAPDMKYVMSHGMSDQTFANTAKKTFSNNPKDKKTGKDGYSTQHKFTAELLRRQANTGKDFSGSPLYTKKEEFTPYDIVLEYLLSTEQVATIEEANYVMTEMDGKTINDIVEMEVNRADIIGGTKAAKDAAAGKGKGLYTPGKGVTKDFKLDPAFKLPKA